MHRAKACVVECIDFRFRNYVDNFMKLQNWGDSYDLISVAGGSRDFVNPMNIHDGEYVWKELDLSIQLHEPDFIVFIDHQDCGGYAQDGCIPANLDYVDDCKAHCEKLKEVKKNILQKYPDKTFLAYHIGLNREISTVRFDDSICCI